MSVTLEQTCGGCPEQYDARDENGTLVGYLRLRHGHFTVQVPDPRGVLVYEAEPIGDGVFDPDERDRYLETAKRKIREYLGRGVTIADEGFREALRSALLDASVSDWDAGDGLVVEIYLEAAVNTVIKLFGHDDTTGTTEEQA